MTFFHLTSLVHAPHIIAEGVIRPTESNIGSPVSWHQPHGLDVGPRVVWLLDTTEVEFDHGLTGSANDKTAYVFEVDVPAIKWTDWLWTPRMSPAWRDLLVRRGGGPEAAEHWYVFPNRIREERWVSHGDRHRHHWKQRKADGGRMVCECGAQYVNGRVVPSGR